VYFYKEKIRLRGVSTPLTLPYYCSRAKEYQREAKPLLFNYFPLSFSRRGEKEVR